MGAASALVPWCLERKGLATGQEARQKPARCEADAWAPELVSLLEQVTAGAAVNLVSCVVVPLLHASQKKLGAPLLKEALEPVVGAVAHEGAVYHAAVAGV